MYHSNIFVNEAMLNEKKKFDPSENKQHFLNFYIKVHCCRFWYLSEWELTNMAFPFWRIYYNTIEGARIFHNEREIALNKGVIAIIPPNTSYSTALKRTLGGNSSVAEGITGGRLENQPKENDLRKKGVVDHLFIHFNLGHPFDFAHPGIYLLKAENGVKAKFEQIKRACIANEVEDFSSMITLCSTISGLLGSLPRTLWNTGNHDARTTRTMLYIDKHLDERLSNELLAEKANMATNSFARLFRQTVGETLQHYITRRRLEKAQLLLHHSTLNIDEIAQECGFCDRYHFTRVFTGLYSLTPVSYRKLHTYR